LKILNGENFKRVRKNLNGRPHPHRPLGSPFPTIVPVPIAHRPPSSSAAPPCLTGSLPVCSSVQLDSSMNASLGCAAQVEVAVISVTETDEAERPGVDEERSDMTKDITMDEGGFGDGGIARGDPFDEEQCNIGLSTRLFGLMY